MQDTLSPKEIVATFPTGKSTVKRLIKETELFLEEARVTEQSTKDFLSSRVSMYDIDICTSLVMAAYYGGEVEKAKEKLKRLYRLLYLYEPPTKATPGIITDEEIERARAYPVRELVTVKVNKMKCLWHNDHSPSMHVYPDQHMYCFVCQKRATPIDIVMAEKNISFVSAVKHLCHV